MMFVVELRDLTKRLPRPVILFRQRFTELLCLWRIRLAFLVLLGLALDGIVDDTRLAPSGGVLGLLCGVLTAAVSASVRLLCDTDIGLLALFADEASSPLQLGQRLGLYWGEPLLPCDICPEIGPFPALSGRYAWALVACALFLFGCGFSRTEPRRHEGR